MFYMKFYVGTNGNKLFFSDNQSNYTVIISLLRHYKLGFEYKVPVNT